MWRRSWVSATNFFTCTSVKTPSPAFHLHLSSIIHTPLVKYLMTWRRKMVRVPCSARAERTSSVQLRTIFSPRTSLVRPFSNILRGGSNSCFRSHWPICHCPHRNLRLSSLSRFCQVFLLLIRPCLGGLYRVYEGLRLIHPLYNLQLPPYHDMRSSNSNATEPIKRLAVAATTTCAAPASVYGRCILANYQDVKKDMCAVEFRAFKDCVQTAVRPPGTRCG